MGLGKRISQYDPGLKFMGLGKRKSQYDPALQYMGLGKRQYQYDPALQYMGLGKRKSQYDPALQYMSLGKRKSQYDPALKYMGLGKRDNSYEPGLKYMGLGKRNSMYDPALKYMGLGKRERVYGSIKVNNQDDIVIDDEDPTIESSSSNLKFSNDKPPSYKELIKRIDKFDPALLYMGQGKRKFAYDPAMKYMGLGKRAYENDSTVPVPDHSAEIMEKHIPTRNSDSIKHTRDQNSELEMRGLNFYSNNHYKTKNIDSDKFSKVSDLEKRSYKTDPGLQIMGLGRRLDSRSYPILKKREYKTDTDFDHMKLEKRDNSKTDDLENEKRLEKFDPALKYMGLGKRGQSEYKNSIEQYENPFPGTFKGHNQIYATAYDLDKVEQGKKSPHQESEKLSDLEISSAENIQTGFIPETSKLIYHTDDSYKRADKRTNKYDPALLFMGLGKRGNVHDSEIIYRSTNDHNEYDAIHTHAQPEITHRSDGKIDAHIVDITLPSNNSSGCGDKCLMRQKRSLLSRNKLNPQDFDDEPELNELIPVWKRERENRPRYNPGWIFIGLGKRGDDKIRKQETIDDDTTNDEEVENVKNQIKYNAFLGDYYELLSRIKDKIQKLKFTLAEDNFGSFKLPTKDQLKMAPVNISKDNYPWPPTSEFVISGEIPSNTLLDFLPSLEKNSK